MKNKNKSITVYFHNDMDLFDELMKMNRFYRSQFIRDCIRNTLFGNKETTISLIQPQPTTQDIHHDNNIKNNSEAYKDDNDPMCII